MLFRKLALFLLFSGTGSYVFAQQPPAYKIAVVGFVHSHVWHAPVFRSRSAVKSGIWK